MTREEAIEILKPFKACMFDQNGCPISAAAIALDVAIEALEERKTGKWFPWKAYYDKDHTSWTDELKCSECGYQWGDEEYKFCPMCGTKMEV